MITEIVEKVMRKGIVNFAEKAGVRGAHSQILIFCKEDTAVPCYKSLIFERPSREVTFNEILGVKVDLLNREAIASPFIQNSLLRFANEAGVSPMHMQIVVYVDEYTKSVGICLYNAGREFKQITLDDVFGQPKTA